MKGPRDRKWTRRSENMALDALAVICQCGFLASTLFTFHGYTCHDERLTMHCPQDTVINVRWAQYGRVRSSTYQCQHFGMELLQGDHDPERMRFKRSRIKELKTGEDCLAASSLKVVMDLCQEKNSCRVRASHRVFKETPCPFSQLEVGYQCLPRFPNKAVSCTGTEMVLQCPPALRLLIINSTYGYKYPGETKCSAQIGFDAECGALCSSYVVISGCHGQRSCKIFVDGQTFGDPCRPGTVPYLTVFYACVPARTLNRSLKRKDFPYSQCESHPTDSAYDNGYYRPTYLTTPLPTTTYKFILGLEGRVFPHWVSVGLFIKRNVEKFILYLFVGASIGLVSLLLVIIGKLIITSRLKRPGIGQQPSGGLRRLLPLAPLRRRTPFGEGSTEFEVEMGRASPEAPRPPGPATISAEELPSRLSAPDDGSPVFVHVESPRESPLLARNHWSNGESNGEYFANGRSSSPPLLRASSLPREAVPAEHSLLLPRERERALNGKSALSEGQLREPREPARTVAESVQPAAPTYRSTSTLPQQLRQQLQQRPLPGFEDERDRSGVEPPLVHSFSNPFRNDESLVTRKSSLRRKPPITS